MKTDQCHMRALAAPVNSSDAPPQGGPLTGLNFESAIAAAEAGNRVARAGWRDKGLWLTCLNGVGLSPCIVMETADAMWLPSWIALQAGTQADDWYVLED